MPLAARVTAHASAKEPGLICKRGGAPLSGEEKAMLVDAHSGATMSINDAHGSVVGVIRYAWNKKKPLGK